MKKTWDLIKFYITTPGVRHKKRGGLIAETTPSQRLEHLLNEVVELCATPHDLKEMADVQAILLHHVQAEGYSMEQFEDCIKEKLSQRLEVPGV